MPTKNYQVGSQVLVRLYDGKARIHAVKECSVVQVAIINIIRGRRGRICGSREHLPDAPPEWVIFEANRAPAAR